MADDTLRDPRWTDETRDVVARQLHGLLCIERDWDRCNLHGQHWSDARTILAALADAGLLLPAGGETRTEWGLADDPRFPAEVWPVEPEDRARVRALRLGVPLQQRAVTVYTGPWVPVDQSGEHRG